MKKIAFYGGGNISQSVIEGLIKAGYKKSNIFYKDRNKKNSNILKKLKIKKLDFGKAKEIDYFILAVKPKDCISALKDILENYENPKIVSFVAGINAKKYSVSGKKFSFMRAMPNTSSKYGLGITGIYNHSMGNADLKAIENIFKKTGIVIKFDKEAKIDTFTGMIGSGPAYFFYLLKVYEKKLLRLTNGNKAKTNKIMINLMRGISVSIEDRKDLNDLIKKVASKKGTTEAGLNSFNVSKLNKAFEKGINSAINRSKEISNEY